MNNADLPNRGSGDPCEDKKCITCGWQKPLSDFPKRGNGNLRDECKACYNKRIRDGRKARTPKRWDAGSLPVSINFSESEGGGEWVSSLYALLKSQGLLGRNCHHDGSDIISSLKRKSRISVLIGESDEPR